MRPAKLASRPAMRTSILALAALCVAFAAAGCGGGGGDPAKPRLPADGFRTQVAQACAHALKRTGAITRPRVPGDLRVFLRRAARVQTSELKRIRALRPPAALDARWTAQTHLLERELALVQGLADTVKGKGDALAAASRPGGTLRALRAAAQRGWRALGITGCGA